MQADMPGVPQLPNVASSGSAFATTVLIFLWFESARDPRLSYQNSRENPSRQLRPMHYSIFPIDLPSKRLREFPNSLTALCGLTPSETLSCNDPKALHPACR